MSWSRRLLKTNAKKAIRQNYWRYIAVCFLVMLICGSSYTSKLLFQQNLFDQISRFLSKVANHLGAHQTLGELVADGMNWLFRTETLLGVAGVIISVTLWILYKVLISNIVRVNSMRFFLESRTYPKTAVKKLGYLYKGKDIRNPAKIMFCMYVKRFLWWFTIIGGIVKFYEYAMIPYILSENPDISQKDAFQLSKQMMHGKKFGLFVLHVSFVPWFMLGLITMGLTNIFYLNAYFGATEAEFYMMVRREIVAQRNVYSKFFIDNYLENKPSEDEILINMFVLEKDYIPNLESDEFSQNVYPMFLRGKDSKWYEAPYQETRDRDYHITTYILIFFLTSIVGWMMDAMIGFMRLGKFLAGGVTYGPWIPAVGATAVLIMLIGRKLMKSTFLNITCIAVIASVVEYGYVWLVELLRGVRYWDFSNYFLNLDGRICLASFMVVGTLGTALFYLIGPELDSFFAQYPVRKKWKLCILFLVLFLVDIVCSIYFRYL